MVYHLSKIKFVGKVFCLTVFLSFSVFAQTDSKQFVEKQDEISLSKDILIEKADISEPLKKLEEKVYKQTNDSDDEMGKNEFSVWGGFSPDTTTAINFGTYEDARYGIVGLRYARRFNNNDSVNLKYTADIIPVAVLNFPVSRAIRIPGEPPRRETIRLNSYAFGAVPIGLQANFRPRKKVKPFVNGGLGVLYFDKDIPNVSGKRLNFIVEAGGGVEIALKNKKAISIGYKLSHISNAYRGNSNPGFDNNLFYVGYTFFTK